MKYVVLIYQGSTPLPGSDAWGALSEDEQKQIYADYGALNQTPGVTAGRRDGAAGERDHRSGPGREDPDHGRAIRRNEGSHWRLLRA